MGMRGVHDSGMEGVKDPKDAAPLLEKIISEQRQLLSRELGDSVPQVFTAYKEVFNVEDMQIGVPQHTDEEDDGPLTGKIAFFNHDKGFGFINFGNNGERVFVHVSQLSDAVNENDAVTFEVENGPRGLTAINVRKV